MRKQKGVTLIALVVTIVVLLILAATAISLLGGENGILTQAQGAKTKTEESEAIEEFKILLQEYKVLENTKDMQLEEFFDENDILYKQVEGSEQYEVEYGKYEIILDKNNLEIIKTQHSQEEESVLLTENIKPVNYGDDVIGYTANGIDEWKIFYNDGKNVYLISKDYANINNICEENKMFTKRK